MPQKMILTDDLGRRVEINEPARRILSLAPAIAENLAAVGGLPNLVGVTTVDDYPPAVAKLPRIGDFGQPAYERILRLKPDLAIVEIGKAEKETVAAAERRMNCPILVQISRHYADVPRHLRQLGDIVYQQKRADALAGSMVALSEKVQRRIARAPRTTVFVEVSRQPLYTAGPGSFIDDLIRLAGGENIVKGNVAYPVFSRELLRAANPDHYIIAAGGDMSRVDRNLPPPLDQLTAVRKGNVHVIPADWLFRPTPRLMKGLEALVQALHP